eukprot:UN24228
MISSLKYALQFVSSSPIMLDRSEPCRSQFLIFEKTIQYFPLESKKLTLTFDTRRRVPDGTVCQSAGARRRAPDTTQDGQKSLNT